MFGPRYVTPPVVRRFAARTGSVGMGDPTEEVPPLTLAAFNAAPADEAVSAMLACCASRRFAQAMAEGRPIRRPTPRSPPSMRPSSR